jgi:hypothetical protein
MLSTPATVGKEPGAVLQELASLDVGNRPRMEDVLPREHSAAEGRPAERGARALAVRHVQQRERGPRYGLQLGGDYERPMISIR